MSLENDKTRVCGYIYIYIHIFSYTTINLYDKPMTSVLYNALGKHFVFKRKEQEQTVT